MRKIIAFSGKKQSGKTTAVEDIRSLDTDCWVRANKKEIAVLEITSSGTVVLTADVRFPNEVKCIQDLGGHVIRLLKNPHNDKHESETALDGVEYDTAYSLRANMTINKPLPEGTLLFDAEMDNRNMTIEEQNEAVWKLINERKWL